MTAALVTDRKETVESSTHYVAAVVRKFSRTRKRQKNKNIFVGRFERLLLSNVSCDFHYGVNDPLFEKALVAG